MLPKDPNILFSLVNTKLRDAGISLDELCAELMCKKDDICTALAVAGYIYNAEMNKFVKGK